MFTTKFTKGHELRIEKWIQSSIPFVCVRDFRGLKIYSVRADGNEEMFTTKFTKGHELRIEKWIQSSIPFVCVRVF